jgi:hypothetical protein
MTRWRHRYQQFPDIRTLLADIAERQQPPMLKATPHASDHALADGVVVQKFPLDVAQHGRYDGAELSRQEGVRWSE